MRIVISGIPIDVQKKNIKNMHLQVKPPDGHVVISAPNSELQNVNMSPAKPCTSGGSSIFSFSNRITRKTALKFRIGMSFCP